LKNAFLKIILPLCIFYLIVQVYYFLIYTPPTFVLPTTWDKFGYYLYLPATFIYHDILHLGFVEGMMKKYELSGYFYQAHLYKNGNYVLSYTLGLALLEFPFFCLGHLMAILLGYPADGFSLPYQFCLALCGTFYAMIGLWFTYRNLSHFFKNGLEVLTMLVIVFCTNYFYYSAFENGMTHSYIFTMYAAVIYYCIRWHGQQLLRYALGMGLAIAIAIVMRPSEIIIVLIPLFWNVYDKESAMEKYKLVLSRWGQLLILTLVVVAIGAIQLIYWKYAAGKWFYNSYKETGQFFDFLKPPLLRGLFSLRKGWFVFSPAMFLPFIGLYVLYTRARPIFLPIAIYIFLNIYIVFSWCQWDYGGGFGSRALVPSYAVLVFPLGFALEYLFSRARMKYLTVLFIALCFGLSMMQTIQYAKGMLSPGGLNTYSYRLLFGKLSIHADDIQRFQNLELVSEPFWYADTLAAATFDEAHALELLKVDHLFYEGPVNPRMGDYIFVTARAKFARDHFDFKDQPVFKLSFLNQENRLKEIRIINVEPLMIRDPHHLDPNYLGDAETWVDFHFAVKRPTDCWGIRFSGSNTGLDHMWIDRVRVENVVKVP
jgi:hypothetical protein